MSKRILSTICAILLCGGTTVSVAQEKAPGPIKIGVIADMSGIYQGNSGKGATVAVELAVEDVGGKVLGRPIEILSADHQTNLTLPAASRAAGTTRKACTPSSMSSARVLRLPSQRSPTTGNACSWPATPPVQRFNMDQCNPYTVQWRSDTYASAKALTESTLKARLQELVRDRSRLQFRSCAGARDDPDCQFRRAGRCWAASVTRSVRLISPPISFLPRTQVPQVLASPTPATIW